MEKEITTKQIENLINELGLGEKPTMEKAGFVMRFIAYHPEILDSAVKGIIECNEMDGIETTKEGVTKELSEMIETWFAVPSMMLEMWRDCCIDEDNYKTNINYPC